MTDQANPPAEPSRLLVREENKPCGCHVSFFSDDSATVSPCVPCGLVAAADNLVGAANAMAAIAKRIRTNQQAAALAAIARNAGGPGGLLQGKG